jgi:HPt (histidine-containing phosphotransfer) domain-containing protein
VEDLATVVAAGDVAQVDLHAHSLKGGAANVGAVRVSAAARELEMLAKSGSLEGAAAMLARVQEELAALQNVAPQVDWSTLG